MLKENQKIITHWSSSNKQHYINKGYIYTKMRDELVVDINDLPLNSHVKVCVICDYCGKEIITTYQSYREKHDDVLGDTCLHCCQIKKEATCMKNFGTKYPMQSKEVMDKSKETCLKKYGKERYSQTDEYQNKLKNTSLEKYGTEHPFQSKEIKQKIVQSNLKKYGSTSFLNSEKWLKESKQILLEKYGTDNVAKNKDVQSKIRQTLYKNGNCPTSKQQIQIYNMLKDIYNICELNYPVSNCSLDCMLIINNCRIDIEYDCIYWHQNGQKDRRRDEFLKSQGYKILRIKARREVPSIVQLQNAIDYLVKDNHSYTEIILDI